MSKDKEIVAVPVETLHEIFDALTLILDATTGSPGFQMIREIRRYAEAARNQTQNLMGDA